MSAKGPKQGFHAYEVILAAAFLFTAMLAGYRSIGWPPVLIVGGSGTAAIVVWAKTHRQGALPPETVLPPFLLTIACLEIHMIEEWRAGFGPAMSRVFNISWTEQSFLLVFAFIGPCIYALTALGLFKRVRLAGFVACFIFIGPGIAEFTHFIFPFLRPAIEPGVAEPLTRSVANGRLVADMRNYWIGTTHRYYFPGLYTAVLPMVPGIYGLLNVLHAASRRSKPTPSTGS